MTGKTLDLTKLPRGPFANRSALFLFDIEDRAEKSLKYFESHPEKEKIVMACDFMDHVLLDCIKGQIKEMKRNALFPVQEAIAQFDFSIKHALIGSYRRPLTG